MQGMEAIVVTKHELKELLKEAGEAGASEILDAFKDELITDPVLKQTNRLRDYIADRSTIANPREEWANGRHIRMLKPAKNGKPKSVAWFQEFKKKSKLNQCFHRPSVDHGRLQEWCFEDIYLSWNN